MTLIEFLAPLRSMSQQRQLLAVMYFFQVVEGKSQVTIAEIREALSSARVAGFRTWNISARLAGAHELVHATGTGSTRLWALTQTGTRAVEGFVTSLPSIDHSTSHRSEAAALRSHVARIADDEARAFAFEAIDCLEIGAHRAAIVFMWVAAVHEVQERIWAASSPATITGAAQSHNPRTKVCKKRDDLVEYNEDLLLQVAHDLGVLDKNQKTELKKALDLRNGCGHPNKLRPGEHRAKAHIEDIVTMLF